MNEIWKKIDLLEGEYEVSNMGRIKSYQRIASGYIRKLRVNDNGYYVFTARFNGKRQPVKVHRLVAMAFCDGFQEGLCVNHKNGNKLDNRSENLEWVTIRENTLHAIRIKLFSNRGENSGMAKLKTQDVLRIRKLAREGFTYKAIAEEYGVHPGTVCKIISRKRWKHV